ncbi:MAG: hypothetical protein WBB94_00665 [Candidatus Saccharimonadaceae bacterium]
MLIRLALSTAILSAMVLLLLLNITSPSTANPVGVLTVFAALYVFSVAVVAVCISVSGTIKRRLKPQALRMDDRKTYYYATIVGVAPVILLAIQSIGGVGVYDVLMVSAFEIIACIYISKQTA